VWEVVARLRELEGSEERRIATLAAESDLYPRLIRIAIDYAALPDEVEARIQRNEAAADTSRRATGRRRSGRGARCSPGPLGGSPPEPYLGHHWPS
jgi:hypothetical protein